MIRVSLGTYNIILISVPSVISMPANFPRGSDINDKVSATALRAYASKYIISIRDKKITYSFIGTDLTFQTKLEKKPFSPPMSPPTPFLPLNTP